MSIFNNKPDMAELLPDSAKITAIKKKLTSIENTREKVNGRYFELDKELQEAKALQAEAIDTSNQGWEGFTKNISRLLEHRKTGRDIEEITLEKNYVAKFQADFLKEHLDGVYPILKQVRTEQEEKVRNFEDTYETRKNSDEIDLTVAEMVADIHEVIERYNYLCGREDLTSETRQPISRQKLKEIERKNFEAREKEAVHDARAKIEQGKRMKEGWGLS